MNKAVLLTGGNLGNRSIYLENARSLIGRQCGKILACSSVYETEAWGKRGQAHFLNQALLVETHLSAQDLMAAVLSIEHALGRERTEKYGARTIDIDIIFFNGDIVKQKNLVIPHPEIQNRRFVLQCLVEIVPNYLHPVLKKTVEKLLSECEDPLGARVLGRG
jgi:2-amino-4-hydroxy-6-hydroxymethyldihydropteridine diphosphokinase